MAFFVVNRRVAEVCAKFAEERKGEIVGVLRVTQRCAEEQRFAKLLGCRERLRHLAFSQR
jgi:hypothetical protein